MTPRARTNDMDLRIVVTSALLASGVPREAIRHEITLDSSSSDGRADMVVALDHALIGIEIKSGKDTLNRLDSQRERYSARFDRLALVLDKRHEDAQLGQRLAIFSFGPPAAIARPNSGGGVTLHPSLSGIPEMPWDFRGDGWSTRDMLRPHAMLSLLWAEEAEQALGRLQLDGVAPGGKRLNARCRIIDHLAEHVSIAQLRPRIAAALRARRLNRWEVAFWARFDATQQEMAA